MEKSPSEPDNASPALSVRPAQGQQGHERHNQGPWRQEQGLQNGELAHAATTTTTTTTTTTPTTTQPRRALPRRANSSSLLTRLLAPTFESGEAIAQDTVVNDRGRVNAGQRLNGTGDDRDKDNDKAKRLDGKEEEEEARQKKMAETLRPLYEASAMTLGAHPITPATKFNLHDMNINHVNSMLRDHREFLASSRFRGTSLERTQKEKMVQNLPKPAVSANSGDTGLTASLGPVDLDAGNISDHPPTEGYRAEYRSWRDGQTASNNGHGESNSAMGKAWSIGDDSRDRESDGQVEKSIREALTGAEHNSRNRKSSHRVGLFRQGLPEDKSKKREGKEGYRLKDRSQTFQESSMADAGALENKARAEEPTSPAGHLAASQAREGGAESYFNVEGGAFGIAPVSPQKHAPTPGRLSRSSTGRRNDVAREGAQARTERPPLPALPAQLLDDLRKRHNLTPAAAKGSSFSKSIPITDSERQTKDDIIPTLDGTAIEQSPTADHPASDSQQSDEDESGQEKISSAVFVPHKSTRETRETADTALPRKSSVCSVLSDAQDDSDVPDQWLVQHELPTAEPADAAADASTSPPLASPEIGIPRAKTTSAYFPQSSTADWTVSAPSDISGYSTKGDESELSQVEDLEVTPTDKKSREYMAKNRERAKEVQETPRPRDAVDLIPYKHQVGGHTTLWRFSKRAVCKQLNSRENEFYETVEHFHPALLKFMPRYIGVLNVTFEKQLKRKPTISNDVGPSAKGSASTDATTTEFSTQKANGEVLLGAKSMSTTADAPRPRIISQSMSGQVPTPTVTFADNRHIIPKSFLQRPLLDTESRYKSLSDTNANDSSQRNSNRDTASLSEADRPSLSDKHATSWGATTVNRKLRYEVFGEAFLQHPIPIQPHKRPGHQHRGLSHRPHNQALRTANSESNLTKVRDEGQTTRPETSDGSLRMRAIRSSAERHGFTAGSPTKVVSSPTKPITKPMPEITLNADDTEIEFQEQAGTSAPEAETLLETPKSKKKRRFSSGGLRRKPEEVANDRGNLKYFAEADDAGYAGDGEDDMFTMDPDDKGLASMPALEHSVSDSTALRDPPRLEGAEQPPSVPESDTLPVATDAPTPPPLPPLIRPVNPKEAQTQRDSRVEYFLLLEDLTAGMKRPCIMDLKMGTRQYGVEADAKKQKSQRRKCAETTSKELGVRVCGLQVWDVATESYIFQDKYFGRDLKVGREFQDALTRFLYDGVDNQSILRHIPTIIHKIDQLEILIRRLNGYRFYAASLLMFYDGAVVDVDDEGDGGGTTDTSSAPVVSTTTTTTTNEKKKAGSPPRGIDFKIADFANCVTAENGSVLTKPCPPRHPGEPDRGFLRGLRSLKKYFLRIQREVMVEEGEGQGHGKKEEGQLRRCDGEEEGGEKQEGEDEEEETTPVVSDPSDGEMSY